MRKVVEEDDSLETCSSARSRMDPTDLETHFEEPRRGHFRFSRNDGSCSADVQLCHLHWLVFIVRRRLAFRSVVETHERLVDVEQDSVV
jgi:hypothetical protein